MTEELRQKANALHKQIEDLTTQIQIVEDMHHCDNKLQIRCEDIGGISIDGDDELKDTIIDLLLKDLNTKKEEVEDEYGWL
jgi:hypothetical protein